MDGKVSFFKRSAMFLYKQACIRGLPLFSSRQVEKDLAQLHPGENIPCIRTEYYVKKLSLTMAVLAVGLVFGVLAKINGGKEILLTEEGSITRGTYLEGEQQLRIKAQLKDKSQEFQVQVYPRLLSGEELEELSEAFAAQLPELIAGKNENLQQVTGDLDLTDVYAGFPFLVEWKSSRPDVLGSSGIIYPPEKAVEVQLTAVFTCQDYSGKTVLSVSVLPPVLTEEEQLYRDLERELLTSEEESREEDSWKLPVQWNGDEIRWKQEAEDRSLLLWGAAAAVAALVYFLSDRDLHQQLERRKKCLKQEYPDLVHQLALYVGAGMTVRGAFQRIAADYERKREKLGKKLPAYEEILYTCRELQSGVSEGAAYEHFGRRTGRQEYIRLSTLLMQNLKRGNSALLERLREEADKAGEERLMQSRRLGEEAGTRLLVPMVLMLAVVMVMIMIPAFTTM